MRSPIRSLFPLVFALAVAACSKSVPVTTNGPSGDRVSTSVARWSGQLKAPNLSSSSALVTKPTSGGATATSYGNVMLTRVGPQGDRWSYEIAVTAPPAAGSQVAWALYSGSCGSPTPPVVATNELPPLDLGSGGSGAVRGEFTARMEPKNAYHLNVYFGPRATDVNNVMLCTKLTFSGKG